MLIFIVINSFFGLLLLTSIINGNMIRTKIYQLNYLIDFINFKLIDINFPNPKTKTETKKKVIK
jgi:hypothetical protein